AWRVLLRVSLRRALAGVVAAALWIAVICFGEITITDLFQVRTFAEEIYTAANLGALDKAAALGAEAPAMARRDLWLGTAIVVMLVTAALAAVWTWLPTSSIVSPSPGWVWRLRRSRWPWTLAAWALTFVIVGLPLASLLGKAGTRTERVEQRVVSNWSAAKAAQMVARSPWEHRREARWSIAIGGLAAGAATVAGVLLAWGLRCRRLPAIPTALLLATGFSIPGPLLGVWLIRLMNQPDDSLFSFLTWYYDNTILAPVVVQLLRALPLATLVLTTQFASVPQDVLDSATSEGARGWWQLLAIVLPLRWPAVVAAACMALVVAVGDMAATLLVLPPGVSTLSTRIFGLLHYGAEDRVSALCLALALGLGALAVAACQLPRMVKNHR
ncbi:MAG: ABC transporter permease subunit, partial [Pirellulales bacterium]|nr:ABC transporter permease subunit [Pirellulales bacterium]